MKKNRTVLALLLTLVLLLTACGAKSDAQASGENNYGYGYDSAMQETPMAKPAMPEPETEEALDGIQTSAQETDGSMTVEELEAYSDKIIYSGHVFMETVEFDEAVAALDRAVKEFGGFVQDSQISGNTRYNGDGTTTVKDRWANYVVRIPAKKFDSFMAIADGIGNVTNSSRTAENVTSQYTDYEARLSSLKTQEERLLAMLEGSGDLESLIKLEERLSEVRYEIESIERNLRDFDQRLAFSTVTLELQEVEIYTPTAPVQRTFGEKLSIAFSDGWRGFVRSVQNITLFAVSALPVLLLLAVIVVVVVLLVIKKQKTKAKKLRKAEESSEEQKQ